MRLMMTIKIPVEHGNRAISDGSMQTAFDNLIEKIQPEAMYFTMLDGLRAAIFFYELKDGEAYRLLEFHEPLFAAMGALIDEQPVLNWADMQKAMKDRG
jgi:hypothetical protein